MTGRLSTVQELLLQVAVLDDETARAAWDRVRPHLDFEHLEDGSFNLVPLVHRRLKALGVVDPLSARMAGVHRKSWFATRLLSERVGLTVAALDRAGVPAIVLRSPHIGEQYYGEAALRPSLDVDLLVAPYQVARAVSVVAEAGAGWGDRVVDVETGSVALRGDVGRCIIHAALPGQLRRGGSAANTATASLWSQTTTTDIGGVDARVLGPTDQLLMVCLHGDRAHSPAPVLWAADATFVLRSGGVDWGRLAEQAVFRGAALRIRSALDYLHRIVEVGVPSDGAARLSALHVSGRERFVAWALAYDGELLGRFPATLAAHAGTGDAPSGGGRRTLADLPSYLRDAWGVDRNRAVVTVAARKAADRLGLRARTLRRRQA